VNRQTRARSDVKRRFFHLKRQQCLHKNLALGQGLGLTFRGCSMAKWFHGFNQLLDCRNSASQRPTRSPEPTHSPHPVESIPCTLVSLFGNEITENFFSGLLILKKVVLRARALFPLVRRLAGGFFFLARFVCLSHSPWCCFHRMSELSAKVRKHCALLKIRF
jgi:hypothetical protein